MTSLLVIIYYQLKINFGFQKRNLTNFNKITKYFIAVIQPNNILVEHDMSIVEKENYFCLANFNCLLYRLSCRMLSNANSMQFPDMLMNNAEMLQNCSYHIESNSLQDIGGEDVPYELQGEGEGDPGHGPRVGEVSRCYFKKILSRPDYILVTTVVSARPPWSRHR